MPMAMNTFSHQGGLTEAELDRLDEFLRKSKGARGMNLEEVDGLFEALIARSEVVLPSEYLPEVFGGEMSDTCEFAGLDEAQDILGLIMRHWNSIATTLHTGDAHLPILLEDDNGVCQGSDWSRGFMRGVDMRSAAWAGLLGDEEECGCMLPVLMLYHEHDEDPELRSGPIAPEKREEIILQMAAGIVRTYRYFRTHRQRMASAYGVEPQHSPGKIGSNEPCPCGSGKKYKRCCGGVTIN
jgi:uncharacterized protein